MRDIILGGTCDRDMLYPQPTQWVDDADGAIQALTDNGPWDEISLMIKNSSETEAVIIFLRDNPQFCPKKLNIRWMGHPLLNAKIGMWLGGITEIVT